MPGALTGLLAAGRRRLRVIWAVASAEIVLPAVASMSLLLVVTARFKPWAWAETSAVLVFVGAALLMLTVAVVLPISPLVVARAIDNGSRNHDALATAFEIDRADAFAPMVMQRAVDSVPRDLADALPVRPRWPRWLVVLTLLMVVGLMIFMTNPQDAARVAAAERDEAIEEVADELVETARELDELPATEETVATIEELAQELRDITDIEEALERLEAVETELNEQLDADALSQRAAIEGLERTLDVSPLTSPGGESAAAQLAAAAESLSDLDAGALDQLAERLAQLAETQAVGDPATAADLAAAGAAISVGDLGAASAALDSASASNSQSASEAAAVTQVEITAADLAELAGRLEALADAQSGQGQGQGQGQGEGQGQGQGQGEGQGQGQGQGQGASGQVQGGGSGTGQGGQGSISGTNNGGPELAGEGTETNIAVPVGGESDILGADAQATGDGTSADPIRANGTTADGVVTVSVRDVVGEFAAQATEALDRLDLVPSEARAVQSYFDRLAEITGAR